MIAIFDLTLLPSVSISNMTSIGQLATWLEVNSYIDALFYAK